MDEDEGSYGSMRAGQLERLVAETVYGFYPGSPSASTRNDSSLSEFFSPVGATPATPPQVRQHQLTSWISGNSKQCTPGMPAWGQLGRAV